MEIPFVKDGKKMTRWSIFPSSSFLKRVHLEQIILPSIFLLFVVIIIFVSSDSWMVSDVDHFYFEMFAVLLSTIIAFYCIARAYLLQEKFSLFVGMGFATVAVVDLLHAVFSYNAAGNSVFLDYFIPQTWFAGRTFLGLMLAIAVIKYAMPPQQQPLPAAAVAAAKEKGKRSKKEKEESTAISSSTNKLIHNNDDAGQYYYTDHKYGSFSPSSNQEQEEEEEQQRQSAVDDGGSNSSSHNLGLQKILLFSLVLYSTLAISIVAVSFFTYFPGIRLADFPIHRPYEIPALVLLLIALFFFYKKKLYKANDAFYKGILGALIIDIFGQVVMSYSATNFHTAHNVAHILKDSGYFIIIISLTISSIQYNKLARDRESIIRLQYAKLREAGRMKDEFINIAAHELRTPIQPILGVSDLLRSRLSKDDYNNNNDNDVAEQCELLDIIIRNAKRLQRLTENVLDVTKIESSLFTLRKERFDLNDVIINIVDDVIVGTDFLKKQEKVRISYHPKQILVYADKSRLAQVIANLIGNSVKFTTEGTISITAEESNSNDRDEIIIRVQDTGQGIDPDVLPALFSKFASTSSSSGGTGLGLFISKKIVEAHGGRIWAENNRVKKKGATFTFTLPITNSHHYHYYNHHYMNNNRGCELL